MTQPPVARPFGEAHLADEARLHPVHVARRYPLGERRRTPFEPAETRAELAQQPLVEAGADLAGVPEVAGLVVTDQESAELVPASRRLREPADDELLAVDA